MAMHDSFRLMTGTSQNVTSVAGTSTASAAFGPNTLWVRVICTTGTVNVRIDSNPVAVVTDTLLQNGLAEYFTVVPNSRLAAIGSGTVNITELS